MSPSINKSNQSQTKISFNTYNSSNAPFSTPKHSVVLKADSSASNHYFKLDDAAVLDNVQRISQPKNVQLPNSTNISVTHQGLLPLSNVLSDAAKTVHILPALTNYSLLSIGQLCNDNCWGLFNKKDLLLFKQTRLILRGTRNLNDGLWDVLIPSTTNSLITSSRYQSSLNVITKLSQSNYELANFFHACLFSPAIRTLQDAIHNNHLVTWPGIDKLNFPKLIRDTTAIEMGHLNWERKNLQSTKIVSPSTPLLPISATQTYHLMSKIIPFTFKEMAYGDITGTFPFTSTRGHKYIYVMYDYDANAILVHPLKTRQAAEITAAWTQLHARLTKHGHIVTHFVLDNEMSSNIKQAFLKKIISCIKLFPHTPIGPMQLNALFRPSRIIFCLVLQLATLTSPLLNGIVSYTSVR